MYYGFLILEGWCGQITKQASTTMASFFWYVLVFASCYPDYSSPSCSHLILSLLLLLVEQVWLLFLCRLLVFLWPMVRPGGCRLLNFWPSFSISSLLSLTSTFLFASFSVSVWLFFCYYGVRCLLASVPFDPKVPFISDLSYSSSSCLTASLPSCF